MALLAICARLLIGMYPSMVRVCGSTPLIFIPAAIKAGVTAHGLPIGVTSIWTVLPTTLNSLLRLVYCALDVFPLVNSE